LLFTLSEEMLRREACRAASPDNVKNNPRCIGRATVLPAQLHAPQAERLQKDKEQWVEALSRGSGVGN